MFRKSAQTNLGNICHLLIDISQFYVFISVYLILYNNVHSQMCL